MLARVWRVSPRSSISVIKRNPSGAQEAWSGLDVSRVPDERVPARGLVKRVWTAARSGAGRRNVAQHFKGD